MQTSVKLEYNDSYNLSTFLILIVAVFVSLGSGLMMVIQWVVFIEILGKLEVSTIG